MAGFISELKRRNVLRTGLAYAMVAWLVLQVAAVTGPTLGLPGWVMTGLITVAFLGFPITLVLAWFFELTDEGIKTQEEAEAAGLVKDTGFGRFIDFVIIVVLLVALGFMAFEYNRAKEETDQRRAQAENLVEFMIEKLQDPLDSVGNLELMDAVGSEALAYYASLDPGEMNDDAVARRARALHTMGTIEDLRGNLYQAGLLFRAAFEATAELLARQPGDPDRIFDHSQSSFYIGFLDWRRGNYAGAEEAFLDYARYAGQLVNIDPGNLEWRGEVAMSDSNLGTLLYEQGRFREALDYYANAHETFEILVAEDSDNRDYWTLELAQTHSRLADVNLKLGSFKDATNHSMAQFAIYLDILAVTPGNSEVQVDLIRTYRRLARLGLVQGQMASARQFLESAFVLAEGLLELDPENTFWMQGNTSLSLDYGEVLFYSGDLAEAKLSLLKAGEMAEKLISLDSTVLDWKINLYLRGLVLQANLAITAGQHAAGLALLESAIEELVELRDENPTNIEILKLLGSAYFLVGESRNALEETRLAREAFEQAVDVLAPIQEMIGLSGKDILARAYLRLGRMEQAQEIARYFEAVGYLHPGFTGYWQRWSGSGT